MQNWFGLLTTAYLLLTIALGGASSQGLPGNVLLQLIAAVFISWILVFKPEAHRPAAEGSLANWLVVAVGAIALAQFLPLPPAIWTLLPGRAPIERGYDLLGMSLPWHTVSMDPWASLGSMVWALPAIAIFLAMRSPHGPSLKIVAPVLVAAAVLSQGLGFMQRAWNGFYPYSITNYQSPVGVFANVNHQATFLLCAMLFLLAHFCMTDRRNRFQRTGGSASAFYGTELFFALGVVLCGSIAGVGLLVLTVAAGLLILLPAWRPRPVFLVALASVGLASALAYGYLAPTSGGLAVDTDQVGMSRADIWVNGWRMVVAYFPFGSGLGTFERAYHLFESRDFLQATYVNHAHNDFLELIIEMGAGGAALLGAFGVWLARSIVRPVFARGEPSMMALGMVIVVIALHSLVDYPLRTAAIGAVFATALGLLVKGSREEAAGGNRR